MIKSIELHDFQSHKKSIFDFSPGVNVITGESNTGKTAVIRGFTLIKDNRPLGDGFIRDGQDMSEVILIKDDMSISRQRGNKVNKYLFNHLGEEICFEAFGSSVPEEINACLSIDDINVQQQHSPYFLVFDSPGHVANYIRTVADLDEIDVLVSNCQSRIRSCKKIADDFIREKKELEVEKKILDQIPLDVFETLLAEFKELKEEEKKLSVQQTDLASVISRYKKICEDEVTLPSDIQDQLVCLTDLSKRSAKKLDEFNLLFSLIKVFNELEQINLSEDVKIIFSATETDISQYNNIEGKINNLLELVENYIKQEGEYNEISKDILVKTDLKEEILQQLVVCPLCKQILSNEAKIDLVSKKE